jgi:hypothetical protein
MAIEEDRANEFELEKVKNTWRMVIGGVAVEICTSGR